MESIRDFLTEEEVEEIKSRVVEQLVNGYFLNTETEGDGDDVFTYVRLNNTIATEVRNATREMMNEEVRRISEEVIAPRIAEMATKMTDRFVKQTGEIVDKINWYWSIK